MVPGVTTVPLSALWRRALEAIDAMGIESVDVLVDNDDAELVDLLAGAGFVAGEEDGTTWMDAEERPEVTPLPEGFVLVDRALETTRPHPMRHRNGEQIEARLRSAPLRPGTSPRSRRSTDGMGFGGCWCTWFHSREGRPEGEKGRPWKERLVREGKARAALVFDGDAAVAWCQYGSPEELPNIHHRKDYEASRHGGAARLSPHVHLRRQGLSAERRRRCGASWCHRADREGGRRRGGGLSAGHAGRRSRPSSSTTPRAASIEQTGFSYERPKGKNHCVMRR